MEIQWAEPSLELRRYVRGYRMQRARVQGEPLRYPFVASPNLILAFYFRNPYQVKFRDSGRQEPGLRAAIVAPQVQCTMDLAISGDFEGFSILFQPGGFYHLFGVPTWKVTGRVWDIAGVLGDKASLLEAGLAGVASFEDRIRVAEQFLLSYPATHLAGDSAGRRRASASNKPGKTREKTQQIAHEVARMAGSHRVAELAQAAGYSERQLERLFLTELGMTPKLYARITRFQAALRAKLTGEGESWTDIAHRFGFYDQMHLVREFRSLGGAAPTELIRQYGFIPAAMLPFPPESRNLTSHPAELSHKLS
jgi:AraC-like DNA-binding protein